MKYFMDTTETIVTGVGFSHYDGQHISWLAVFLIVTVLNCIWFRKTDQQGRNRWKKVVAILLLLDELFKQVMLIAGGRFDSSYFPLHLCSINIFIIAIHAWRPNKLLNSFLYTVCIPGAIAALLFPTWTKLPLLNFMHLHSFTVHILLALYPIVLTAGGELKPRAKDIPKCLLLLGCMAIPIYGINLLLDENYMFLMYADEGNPLYWFEQNWGNHLLGFPVILLAILVVMFVPVEIYHKFRKTKV